MQIKLDNTNRAGRHIDAIAITSYIDTQKFTENNSDRCFVRDHYHIAGRILSLDLCYYG